MQFLKSVTRVLFFPIVAVLYLYHCLKGFVSDIKTKYLSILMLHIGQTLNDFNNSDMN